MINKQQQSQGAPNSNDAQTEPGDPVTGLKDIARAFVDPTLRGRHLESPSSTTFRNWASWFTAPVRNRC